MCLRRDVCADGHPGAAVTGLLTAFPKERVVEMVTLSDVTMAGSAAFHGVVANTLALFVQQYRQRVA